MMGWKVGSALGAGCTLVVKPSEFTPYSALELAAAAQVRSVGALNILLVWGPAALFSPRGRARFYFFAPTDDDISVGDRPSRGRAERHQRPRRDRRSAELAPARRQGARPRESGKEWEGYEGGEREAARHSHRRHSPPPPSLTFYHARSCPGVLHRLRAHGLARHGHGGAEHQARHAGAGRQVAAARVRRREPRHSGGVGHHGLRVELGAGAGWREDWARAEVCGQKQEETNWRCCRGAWREGRSAVRPGLSPTPSSPPSPPHVPPAGLLRHGPHPASGGHRRGVHAAPRQGGVQVEAGVRVRGGCGHRTQREPHAVCEGAQTDGGRLWVGVDCGSEGCMARVQMQWCVQADNRRAAERCH